MKLSVEIPQYKAVNKGALQAFFTMIIKPMGIKIIDCRYFCCPGEQDRRWFSFPSKEIKKEPKSDYVQLIYILNTNFNEELKTAVLKAIDEKISQGNYHAQENPPAEGEENQLQGDPSLLW